MTPAPWLTPTPIFDGSVVSTPVIDLGIAGNSTMSESMVQGYNMLNAFNFMDIFFMLVILIAIIGGLVMVINQVRDV